MLNPCTWRLPIICPRLKDLTTGTRNLKFHATVPIITHGQKIGLINLVSKETQQLNEKQLSILNTISELIGMAIQRTRLQESYMVEPPKNDGRIREVLERVFLPQIETLLLALKSSASFIDKKDHQGSLKSIEESLKKAT